MNKDLLEKYQALINENETLKEEIRRLRAQLSNESGQVELNQVISVEVEQVSLEQILPQENSNYISMDSDSADKVKLFLSLFRGRTDVYAKRWESKKGVSGYSPVCANEWKPGICQKPAVKCTDCKHKVYLPLDEAVIESHLRGHDNFVAGIYPMCADGSCNFLTIDFDKDNWQEDVSAIREVCREYEIPVAVERSRSGNGAHVWFFFECSVSAPVARRFGSALLTCAMSKRHEITFKSYDRLFPNQDTLPKGGFGNLIALPLQKTARTQGNSVFIDESYKPYRDQWSFLAAVQKIPEDTIEKLIPRMCQGNELGFLKLEEDIKPWEKRKVPALTTLDFALGIELVKANMLYVRKKGISQGGLNYIKRLAAFPNPEFYKAQAMRLPTYNKPRIISCAEEASDYLGLPRGCESDIRALADELGIQIKWIDKTSCGRKIDVMFVGRLRDEQPLAAEKLLKYENGILCGTTAFGKTVVAIKLIAERKVNTLILVDKVSLVSQWRERLTKFLKINEELPGERDLGGMKLGRKRKRSIIGQLGNGKNTLNGIIDIALIQSLNRKGEIKDCINDYGMIIVDECHHVSAFSFESVLARATAKYVYGLTATPTRKDGHHPIILMQCGPIRYRDDARKQAEKRPFEHYIVPRFTALRNPVGKDEQDVSITDLYADIVENELRNQQIINDVVDCYEKGRNCLILTERTAHVELLAKGLGNKVPEVITAVGGRGAREARETLARIANAPVDKPLVLVATGKYIGEGFDEPRLDTLFLAMPISWKGTLQQYAGRLHRLFEGKKDVQIFDYVDTHVRMLQKMYYKRLNGYAAIGYKVRSDGVSTENVDFIYDKHSFFPVYTNDIRSAAREVLIVSPFMSFQRTQQMFQLLEGVRKDRVRVIIVTRPSEDFLEKDRHRMQQSVDFVNNLGVQIVFKSKIHQKFTIVDQKIVWYGSINFLSYGSAEESVMRLESANIAYELVRGL